MHAKCHDTHMLTNSLLWIRYEISVPHHFNEQSAIVCQRKGTVNYIGTLTQIWLRRLPKIWPRTIKVLIRYHTDPVLVSHTSHSPSDVPMPFPLQFPRSPSVIDKICEILSSRQRDKRCIHNFGIASADVVRPSPEWFNHFPRV